MIIMEAPQYIRVEGHTDNLPINTTLFLLTGSSPWGGQ